MALSNPLVLRAATFDPKLKVYIAFSPCIVFLVTIVGIPLIPLWLIFSWFWWAPRHFDSLSCELTERSLLLKRGVIFKVEKSIPLDKIQDMALRHGPLLNAFGLASITIETAGQSGGGAGQGDAVLTGVIGAREFRDAVLAQREGATEVAAATVLPATPASPAGADEAADLLREIRDTLVRIEGKISDSPES